MTLCGSCNNVIERKDYAYMSMLGELVCAPCKAREHEIIKHARKR